MTDKIKNYFEEIGIPYDDIDENIRELVYCFNKIGLTTKFSCEGHKVGEPPEIIFADSIKETDIDAHSEILLLDLYIGEFKQWIRCSDPYTRNRANKKIWKNYKFTIDAVRFNGRKIPAIQHAVDIIRELYDID